MAGMPEAPDSANPALLIAAPRFLTPREAASACILAVLSAACSAGLCVAAVLMHPPAAIVPLLVITCVACPVFGTWELPLAVAALRATRAQSARTAIARFRRSLAEMPEVDHPLGH
jgi:hypothetical protein